MQDLTIGAIYEHYKGKRYRVIGLAKHSETLEDLVVYENELGSLWCRPLKMWNETVMVQGITRPRFAKVSEPG